MTTLDPHQPAAPGPAGSEPTGASPAGTRLVAGRYRIEDGAPPEDPARPDHGAPPDHSARPETGGARSGGGGAGQVRRAVDTVLDRAVTLRRVRTTGLDGATAAQVWQRTLHESHLASRLRHPNVVPVLDVATDGDQLWIVAEHLPSRDCGALLATQGPFPPHLAAQVGAQIAEALAVAHSGGLLHRAVSPADVLIDAGWNARLTGFGDGRVAVVPRSLDPAGPVAPEYLASELARGEHAGPAADVYGLGATVAALVSGVATSTRPGGGPVSPTHPPAGDPGPPTHRPAAGPISPPVDVGPLTAVFTSLTVADPARRPDAATARDMFVAAAHQMTLPPPPPAPASPAPNQPTPGRSTPFGPASSGLPAHAQPFGPTSPGVALSRPQPSGPHASGPHAFGPHAFGPHAFGPQPFGPQLVGPALFGPTGSPSAGTSGSRPGGRPRWVLPAVLVAVVVLLISMVAGVMLLVSHARQPEAAPATDRYLPDPRAADACALAGLPDFALFGTPHQQLDSVFGSCGYHIDLNGGGTADVNFALFNPRTLTGPVTPWGDFKIVKPDPTATVCYQSVVLPDQNIITIRATVADTTERPCVLAGLGTDAVVAQLQAAGTVPRMADLGPANSLRRVDSCTLLTSADLAEVPGIAGGQVYPMYGRWNCDWGSDLTYQSTGAPWVNVLFQRAEPMIPGRDGTQVTIAGRSVYLLTTTYQPGRTECIAQIVHLHTMNNGQPLEESANIGVHAPVPPDQQCRMAGDLAAKVIPRLPPATN